MQRKSWILFLALGLMTFACDDDDNDNGDATITADSSTDASNNDASNSDASNADAANNDASNNDASNNDGGSLEAHSTTLSAKNKIDFLFVIDNSASMCEEQANLAQDFTALSKFLFDDLGASADYRIAVTSTDMKPFNGEMGAFLKKPAEYKPSLSCIDPVTNQPLPPDTEDCFAADFKLDQVLQSSGDEKNIASKEDLEKKFRCLATLGTQGDSFEKGLEAMRVSLSCAPRDCLVACMNSGSDEQRCRSQCYAPNSALFEPCCNDDGTYKQDCQISEGQKEPVFLRPDALLAVIFLSDEDDCSDPDSNPRASKLAICKYGTADNNGDGLPDGFADHSLCGPDSPADCFKKECDGLTADECYSKRCRIERGSNANCEWHRDDLTPVRDYYEFLTGLKGQPIGQLMVATLVGQRAYVSGKVITYQEGPVKNECLAEDAVHSLTSEACCPDGQCFGPTGAFLLFGGERRGVCGQALP